MKYSKLNKAYQIKNNLKKKGFLKLSETAEE